jgi:alpha-mannosidase
VLEAVRCAQGGAPIDEVLWRRVVFAQFHDYIPGSSIHEVYDEARVELAGIAHRALQTACDELGASGTTPALFNPLPRERVHRLGLDAHGRVESVLLPPLGGGSVAALPRVASVAPAQGSISPQAQLSNERVQARFDGMGRVAALCIDGIDLALRSPLCDLVIHPDQPHLFEAWDIDRQTLSLGAAVQSPATVMRGHSATGSTTLSFTRSLGDAGEATLHYTLGAGAAWLRLDIDLNWRQPEQLLKLAFPTAYAARQARYAAPFGSVLRSQVPGESADEAKWEVPASRWAAVADETEHEGLFIVTEAKYGFSCRDGELGLSLVRSAAVTCGSAVTGGTPSSHPQAMRRNAGAPYSDIGAHRIALAFGRYSADAPRDEQPAALADTLYTAPLACAGRLPLESGFLGLDGGETLQPTWAQPLSPGRWVLRLNETLGRRGQVRVRLADGWRATQVDLRALPVGDGREVEQLDYTPYALLSLLIERRVG